MDTRWHSWLRHCATSRKVARLIPVGVTGIFNWPNPYGHATALGSTRLPTEMSTRSIFSRLKGPSIFSGLNRPSIFSGLKRHSIFSGPKTPSIFSEPNRPSVFSDLKRSSIFSGLKRPSIFSGLKRPVPSADNLTTFMYRLSRNSGSLQPSGHFQAHVETVLNPYMMKINLIRWNLQIFLGVRINVL